jgi:hypothetical protein
MSTVSAIPKLCHVLALFIPLFTPVEGLLSLAQAFHKVLVPEKEKFIP